MSEGLKARLVELRGSGFNRLYQNGQIYEFSTPESLIDIDFAAPLFVLLDRIVVDRGESCADCGCGGDCVSRGGGSDF